MTNANDTCTGPGPDGTVEMLTGRSVKSVRCRQWALAQKQEAA